jgi:hypothetical protein
MKKFLFKVSTRLWLVAAASSFGKTLSAPPLLRPLLLLTLAEEAFPAQQCPE